MKKSIIRMKVKPAKPKSKNISRSVDMDDGTTFQADMDGLGCQDASKIVLKKESYGYGDCYDDGYTYARFTRPQTDQEFAAALALYQRTMLAYDLWYKENKIDIDREIARRKAAIIDRRDHSILREEKRLKDALAKVQKRLGR